MLSCNSVQRLFKRINQRFYHFSGLVAGNASAGERLALIDFLTRGLSEPTSLPRIQGNLTCIVRLREPWVLSSPGDRWQFVSTLGDFFFYVCWRVGMLSLHLGPQGHGLRAEIAVSKCQGLMWSWGGAVTSVMCYPKKHCVFSEGRGQTLSGHRLQGWPSAFEC